MRTLLAGAVLVLSPAAADAALISRIEFGGTGIVTFKDGALLSPDVGDPIIVLGEIVFDDPSISDDATGVFTFAPGSNLAVFWDLLAPGCCATTNFGSYDDLTLTFVGGVLTALSTSYVADRGFEFGALTETTFRRNSIVPDGPEDDFYDYGGVWGIEDVRITTVPEPAAWALMIAGFGLAGAALRHRRRVAA